MAWRGKQWEVLRQRILERDDHTCRYCGEKRTDRVYAGPKRTKSALCVDHIVPLSRGGSDEEANLVTACVDCNLKKHANTWAPVPA